MQKFNAPPGRPAVCKRSKAAAVLVIATSPVLKAVNNQLHTSILNINHF